MQIDLIPKILENYQEYVPLRDDLRKLELKHNISKVKKSIVKVITLGISKKAFEKQASLLLFRKTEVLNKIDSLKISVDFKLDSETYKSFKVLSNRFIEMDASSSLREAILDKDIVLEELTTADKFYHFKSINIKVEPFVFINSSIVPCVINNGTYDGMYIYPDFIVIIENDEIDIIPMDQISLNYKTIEIKWDRLAPQGAVIVGHSWYKSKKDGTRDLRFKDNYQVPIIKIGQISIQSKSSFSKLI